MASLVAGSSVATPPASLSAPPMCSASSERHTIKAFSGLKGANIFSAKNSQLASKTVANGSRVNCMQVVNPYTNIKYETLSYLPPLTAEQIAKQVDYIVGKGWIPCLEFDKIGSVYRENFRGSGYYDGRYWTMWKLPMFGCQDSAAVLREIAECSKAYPGCYVRVLGFDNRRQVQCISFLVHHPERT